MMMNNIEIEIERGLWRDYSISDFDISADGYCEHKQENISFTLKEDGIVSNVHRYICDYYGEITDRIPLRFYVQ